MNKQVRVFQIKEIHHKQRAKSYAQQIEDGFLIHHQNYQSAYKGQVGPSETPVTVRGRLEEQRPNTFIGRPFGVSDVILLQLLPCSQGEWKGIESSGCICI